MKASFLIAAPNSGSGKTTIARGVMALFVQKGYRVQPFKCGPDYIDTKFHEAVCGRPSVNLDTFMATPEHVRELFAHYGADADVCIVEGMMGLFDGYDRDKGSSYEIARVLDIPVVLVVDARSAAYSMAALLSGFLHFRDDIRFAGVIYNKVGSERHFQMLRQVCDDLHVPCLGYLPKSANLEQGSRYLGLDFSEKTCPDSLVQLLNQHVNWQHIVGHASQRDNIVGHASQRDNASQRDRLFADDVTLGSVTYYAPRPQFVDTSQYIHITSDKLPHWQQEGKTVFVTFRLADSLPQSKLQELQAFKAQWLNAHPQPWNDETRNDYEKSVRQKTDCWLDQGYGSCILALPDVRKMVADAFLAKHGTSYWLHHFVIMPNHVHLLVTPIGNNSLTKTIGGIKQYTARIINLHLGTKGDVWQRRTFDHLVRNESQYERCVSYIKDNPKYIPSGTFTLFSAVVGNASQRYDNCHTGKRDLLTADCHAGKRDLLDCHAGKRDLLDCHAGKRDLLRVLIARNEESFSFIYQETIDRLGDVTFFDPEKDVPDLDSIDLLYLPGGYPEKHLEALVNNEACRKAIKDYAERGGRIIAECGGMMYLCRSIVGEASPTTPQSLEASPTTEYPMCGVLPYTITARKSDRKLSLGYRMFELDGKEYRGHEFHYTQFLRSEEQEVRGERIVSATQVYNAKGEPVDTPVFKYKNVLASYTHLAPTPSPSRGERSLDTNSIEQGNQAPLPSGGVGGGLHSIMLAGTGSDVGKSVIATALCRIFKQDGYHPAPFKAQNMALNSYATPEGLEIGRAQAVQAEAAGIPCHTDMNPLLLKPNSDHTSQVVLHGKPIGNKNAYDYWKPTPNPSPREGGLDSSDDKTNYTPLPWGGAGGGLDFRTEVCAAFDRLAIRYNPIVMEGAGSISELNLRDTDLVNLPMARHANADVILVADIDRGGVFASVYGSIALQTPEDRKLIKGIIINKFRGDLRLFDNGRKMLEDICGVPVLGVVPYYKDIHIEEEDSVSLEKKQRERLRVGASAGMLAEGKVNVAVVLLRHISNFTDFDTLERDPRVNLFYTNNVSDLQRADIIILPGTKSTLDDLLELRRNGCAQAIIRAHRDGKTIIGICGGYQMLGVSVEDPDGIEGSIATLPGLGLLPIRTTMTPEKTTRQVTFQFNGHTCHGYEIHQGVTVGHASQRDNSEVPVTLGSVTYYDHCIGTYIHGFLDNAPVIEHLLSEKVKVKSEKFATAVNYPDFKEQQYDLLAAHVRKYVDIPRLYQILTESNTSESPTAKGRTAKGVRGENGINGDKQCLDN